jgi:hypothetical protein
MYFSYFEKGHGELCFGATILPFVLVFSERIPEIFAVSLN